MSDDYLWDKSGQPDPEIQQLEEILGTLRYQPRPLDLPNNLRIGRKRNHVVGFAIAASILLAVLAAGVWFAVRSGIKETPQTQTSTRTPAVETPAPNKSESPVNATSEKDRVSEKIAVVNKKSEPSSSARIMSTRERREALEAKEQLMFALRLTTEKLGMVQRKTQTPATSNQIKNQHRIG